MARRSLPLPTAPRAMLVVGVTVGMVAGLAGCSQIPTSGPVIGGSEVVQPGPQRPFVRVEAPPPRAGAGPEVVVNGFIEAMSSSAPGFETARLFLTEDAGLSWDVAAGITVYSGPRPDVEEISGGVRVTMNVVGRVGADGAYRPAQPGTTEEFILQLTRENGEWRITNPPEGILIAEFSFDREYEPYNVYFFDPGFDVLVPDPVYLPAHENAATLLAQRLLEGPSGWLAPAVHTAFPDETGLGVNAVPVESGTAMVELSSAAGSATPEQRELMTAQLAWTLGQLPEVQEVAVVTSGGIPLWQGGEAASPGDGELAVYDPDVLESAAPMYFLADDGVSEITGDDARAVPGAFGAMPDVREVAVNTGGNRMVAVSGSGQELRVASIGDSEVTTLAQGVDLTSPAWDRTGLVWAVDHGVPGPGIVVWRPDGERVNVVAPGLEGRDVDRLAVSLDGTRIALVVEGTAYVAGIVREANGRPALRIEQLRRVGPEGVALDVAWNAADSVVVLLQTGDHQPSPYIVGLSGEIVTPRGLAVDDVVRVAAAPNDNGIVVETSSGVLLEQLPGNRWGELVEGSAPAYPG